MRLHFAATAFMIASLLGHAALAQDGVQPIYAITYIEVAPKSAAEARQLILTYSADARKASGAVQIDALQRIGYASHFALIEQWQSQKSKDAYAATAATTTFREALAPLRIAAYDERIYAPLAVGSSLPATSDTVAILTHVDVIPTAKDAGAAKVKEFADQSRGKMGNLRFDALVQTSRANHMTVIEFWDTQAGKEAHISMPAARSFRQDLYPISGSLYDERAYKLLH
jgi:quinol monooxygenase YgiN